MRLKFSSVPRRGAFTLLEVMVAAGIFFMGTLVILALVSSSLENARRLQRPIVDAGVLAAELSLTNQLVEVSESGELADMLGDNYKDYIWSSEIVEVQTNKLFRVDYAVQRADDKSVVSKMSILLFRPQSPAGTLDGATK